MYLSSLLLPPTTGIAPLNDSCFSSDPISKTSRGHVTCIMTKKGSLTKLCYKICFLLQHIFDQFAMFCSRRDTKLYSALRAQAETTRQRHSHKRQTSLLGANVSFRVTSQNEKFGDVRSCDRAIGARNRKSWADKRRDQRTHAWHELCSVDVSHGWEMDDERQK